MFPFIFLSSGSKYDLFHIFQCEICLQCLTSFLQHATCMCFRRQTVCRPNSSEINAKNKLFKTNKQTNNNNELKQFFQLMLLRKKKKIPPKMSLIGVRTQTTALPVQGSNHWASKPTASWSFFIFYFYFFFGGFLFATVKLRF